MELELKLGWLEGVSGKSGALAPLRFFDTPSSHSNFNSNSIKKLGVDYLQSWLPGWTINFYGNSDFTYPFVRFWRYFHHRIRFCVPRKMPYSVSRRFRKKRRFGKFLLPNFLEIFRTNFRENPLLSADQYADAPKNLGLKRLSTNSTLTSEGKSKFGGQFVTFCTWGTWDQGYLENWKWSKWRSNWRSKWMHQFYNLIRRGACAPV